MTPAAAPIYIETEARLVQWLEDCQGESVVAIDTESDSLHHYPEKVCLIQMSVKGRDALIDTLAVDVEPLRGILSDAGTVKILHDAVFDLVCLKRDFQLEVCSIFDTMIASRLLGYQSFGLGPILKERFAFSANKKLQRSDWARRPLSSEQLDYARFDTHFLEQLRLVLIDELEAAGRLHWAEEEFRKLPGIAGRVRPRTPGSDPDAFWRVKGVRNLHPEVLGRVRALHRVRETIAERIDRPPFKVLSDAVLVEIALRPPARLQDFRPRPGLRRAGIDRFGEEIVEALSGATPVTGAAPRGLRKKRHGRFLDPEARDRYEALRDARKQVAQRLGIDPEVALGNAALEQLAKSPPRSLSEVRGHSELVGWRAEYFADSIHSVLC